ncbi:unnamed protein product [Polarella glacialis]|uniref:Ribosomal protein S13 n=2 Tax=Polarella glacialis TaxID=89957 RepID=A0A813ESD9_POLGL|nr:unnamed protein product [Polarella glacialis]
MILHLSMLNIGIGPPSRSYAPRVTMARFLGLALLLGSVAVTMVTFGPAFVASSSARALATPRLGSTTLRLGSQPVAALAAVSAPTMKASPSFAGVGAAALLIGVALARRRCKRTLSTQRRLRLAGKEIPRNKEIAWALMCSVFGIGKTTAFTVTQAVGIDPHTRTGDLSEEEELRLAEELGKYTLENPLRRMYKANCSQLLEIKHRRGIRMQKGLPVRFQRSKTNNRNARKLNPYRL